MSNRFGPRTRLLGPSINNRVSQWIQRSLIQSIQTGTIAVATGSGTNTGAITAVDTARTVLLHNGMSYSISGTILTGPMCRLALTNSTTITATDVVTADGATATVAYTAIQFMPGVLKSIQRGTVTTAAGTAAITAVNTAKSYVNLLGFSTSSDDNQSMPRLTLTNSTTVTITAGGTNGATASYEVWEWY